jgi:hypothetical protein
MLYLPITETWIVSRTARRVYFVCALAALSFLGVIIASTAALTASDLAGFQGFPIASSMVRLLLWPGVFGAALLWIAMSYFWFSFDDSGWLKKALWFLPLYLALPVGPVFYYFVVYRRSGKVSNCK